MIQAKPRFLSFEEYLSYDDGTENLYELFNGELIEVPPESGLNIEIANFLFSLFLPIVGHRRLRGHGLELEVRGEPKNRYPDLTIIREEQVQRLKQRNTIRLSMAPPLLVVEVVSPGEIQRDRDYIAKRSQYQDLGIPEYWIVDPQTKTILVLELVESVYREAEPFTLADKVRSPQFGELNVSVSDILGAG
ncbi:MAG TPA: Uma2 family endonuclease [Leptolyngbyaceae cyanobacterium M33_DOE_097]|uniref:Uma2 family endonuclease n=1 Tax=Oscillatoriales cyanobacterium SpSt-418 TaxID=2282169 RepID=A0A7C3KGJ1_9CYAN|nr:Uma2 family endonuclease [Leptolyngbyaceae cyanobacterium M33_DOE_097]